MEERESSIPSVASSDLYTESDRKPDTPAKCPHEEPTSTKRKAANPVEFAFEKKRKLQHVPLSPSTTLSSCAGLPPEIWQNIFLSCSPVTLGRLLQVNRAFHSYLTDAQSVSDAKPTSGRLSVLRPESIWSSVRNAHFTKPPRPLPGMSELEMWRLILGKKCQFCGKIDHSISGDKLWDKGPGPDGVRIVWSFGIRACGKCLLETCDMERTILFSPDSVLLPALPFAFVTSDLNLIPAAAFLESISLPPNLKMAKYYYKPHVQEMQRELEEAKSRGFAAADEWSKGLESRGKERMSNSERWERWELKYQWWLRHQDSRRTTVSMSSSPSPQYRQQTGSPAHHLVTPSVNGSVGTTAAPQSLPPKPAVTSQLPFPPPNPSAPFYPPKTERSIHDANEAKAARKADIERLCQSLVPPIPPNVLRHMESFKAAIQISQQMTDSAWGMLKPRLLAQRAVAEQTEMEHAARVASLQNKVADRRQQDVNHKEVLDREWEESQKPIRDRLSSYADDFIAKEWETKAIDDENSPRFAAELLLYVRRRFYADLAKDGQDSSGTNPDNGLDPLNRAPKKLILENMKWVYDNKIKPLTENRKEIFLCNGSGCEGNQRFYGFEGVIQHYGAKHTNSFSVGNIVVRWREAEWPEEPPFQPDPNGSRNAGHTMPPGTGHGHSGHGPFPYFGYSRGATTTPHLPLLPQASPGPYNAYGGRHNGPFQPPPPPPPNVMQGSNYDYQQPMPPQPYGPTQPIDAYSSYQTMAPSVYAPAPVNPGFLMSSAIPGVLNPSMQGNVSGFSNPYGAGTHTSPHQAPSGTAMVETEAQTSNTEYRTTLYEKQVRKLEQIARDVWTSTSGIKDFPNSVRIYVVMQSVISKFLLSFNHEPLLDHFIDALQSNSSLKPLKSATGLSCKACHLQYHRQSSIHSYPPRVEERRTFSVLSLFSHFKSDHLNRPGIGSDYQNGQQLPHSDWKEYMIELPSERTISGLIHAPGMDDDKLHIIAKVFPTLFPTPLPRIGVVDSTGVASASRTGSKDPKESNDARRTPAISAEGSGPPSNGSPHGRSPQVVPRPGEEEYDPLRPALPRESRHPTRPVRRTSSHRRSPPSDEHGPVIYESRYYLTMDPVDDEHTGPSRRGFVELSPSSSRSIRDSGSVYEGIRERRPMILEREGFHGPGPNGLVYSERPGLDPQERIPYVRQVRYLDDDRPRSEYRLVRGTNVRRRSQSPSKAEIEADRFLNGLVPGEDYPSKVAEQNSREEEEGKPKWATEAETEDGSRYTPPPLNMQTAADDHLDSMPQPGSLHATPGPPISNGSRYEDLRSNGHRPPTPESGGAARRPTSYRRRERHMEHMPSRYARYMSAAREEPYARGNSIARSHSRYERRYERYDEARRRLDQETPQPSADPEPERNYSRDHSVDQGYPEDPYYHQIRHPRREYIPVDEHPPHSAIRYRYAGDSGDAPPPPLVDDYDEHPTYQYVRVHREPREARAPHPNPITRYVPDRPSSQSDHLIEYVPMSYNRDTVHRGDPHYDDRQYVFYEERPARPPYDPEGQQERIRYEANVGPADGRRPFESEPEPPGVPPPLPTAERAFLNSSR
ncbi:hypothetical protein AOQ84DRAFT_335103 [Glonium stellatum]|uniref:DUF7892 domain-containing protein n=1 Tax=Glonium stellatum TaxID=574774 RepID=A0A8E2JWN1_9PEZI|nr:hypothetical protein AOQ84DRAFT_335103 [Glonium stellatum]